MTYFTIINLCIPSPPDMRDSLLGDYAAHPGHHEYSLTTSHCKNTLNAISYYNHHLFYILQLLATRLPHQIPLLNLGKLTLKVRHSFLNSAHVSLPLASHGSLHSQRFHLCMVHLSDKITGRTFLCLDNC